MDDVASTPMAHDSALDFNDASNARFLWKLLCLQGA